MWAGRDASNRMISYYSYLFTFPSREAMIAIIIALCTVGCSLAFTLAWGLAYAVRGLLYGLLGLTAPLLVSDAMVEPLFKDDIFLTPRRFTILSYASCIIYVAVVFLSSLAVALTGLTDLLERGVMFAVAVNASLRHLTISVFSTKRLRENLVATFMQPVLCFATGVILLPILRLHIPILGFCGVAITVVGAQLILSVMGMWKDAPRELRPIPLFRAFILAWAEEMNKPLEDQITLAGSTQDLCIDALTFSDTVGQCRAALIVPYIHPGPFRNVGSSALPNILTSRLGKKLGCEVLVPHGVSTHERDLTRSCDVERVADALESNLRVGGAFELASPLIWAERHGAQVSCQIFGDVALLTLTLSPKSYDDLPEELGDKIMEAAAAMGVTPVVIDSHNSIQQEDDLNESDVDNLFHAATEAIRCARAAPRYAFSVGAARVIPREWGLDDGIGPDGVAAFAVRLENGYTCVYAVVDGNNMRSGLRERVIDALKSRGVDEAEVLTSDTHLVNAIGATTHGYYPIGERTDGQKIIGYVVEAVEAALSKLERCRATHIRTVVSGLTVLGEAGLNLLSGVLESAFALFKRTAAIATSASLLLSFAVIFLL